MSNYRHDPTASAAIGSIDRQLSEARKRAREIVRLRRKQRVTPAMEAANLALFTGIFRRAYLAELEKAGKEAKSGRKRG